MITVVNVIALSAAYLSRVFSFESLHFALFCHWNHGAMKMLNANPGIRIHKRRARIHRETSVGRMSIKLSMADEVCAAAVRDPGHVLEGIRSEISDG